MRSIEGGFAGGFVANTRCGPGVTCAFRTREHGRITVSRVCESHEAAARGFVVPRGSTVPACRTFLAPAFRTSCVLPSARWDRPVKMPKS